jgi:hypothetical protein
MKQREDKRGDIILIRMELLNFYSNDNSLITRKTIPPL